VQYLNKLVLDFEDVNSKTLLMLCNILVLSTDTDLISSNLEASFVIAIFGDEADHIPRDTVRFEKYFI
jgi:hypothetical protein